MSKSAEKEIIQAQNETINRLISTMKERKDAADVVKIKLALEKEIKELRNEVQVLTFAIKNQL